MVEIMSWLLRVGISRGRHYLDNLCTDGNSTVPNSNANVT